MSENPYVTLGISPEATDDEVKEAYRALARKYHPDNFTDDNPLKDLANEKMQAINAAYDEIQKERAGRKSSYRGGGTYYEDYSGTGETSGTYAEIRRLLNAKRFYEASKMLDDVPESDRTPEWHYLESIVLMRKGRVNDAMRELGIACEAEPDNLEYQKAKEMFNNRKNGYGSTYYGNETGRDRSSDVCEMCIRIKMLDCLCECLGGDLIPCI